jgi:hypothetical protein
VLNVQRWTNEQMFIMDKMFIMDSEVAGQPSVATDHFVQSAEQKN